ncbi:unnamed protein product [Lepeophtheirus salmonis]|uniref:(salmon louse) hypothetical protein n=1 Tax=Lepeophtheirus salmonis TaxID=72036 RepID=A0A7R8H1J3_LEPSM|nr:unnamed protein product [Lepeophtheirus salmonis]CAF2812391.1 unnamed protein product [Lepeophtheirus salmonis]
MFILHSPRFSQLDQTQLDLSTIAALLLLKHVYTVENAEYITLDHLIGKKFTLPFDYEAMDDGTNEFEESPENMKGFKLMKVYWNLCYEGLSFMCSSSQTKFSENFDNRLVLQEDERTMIAASFSKENLSNPSKLIYSQTPVAFLKEVDFMNSQKLIDDNEELISTDYDHYNNIDSNVSSWIDQLLKTDQTIFKLLLRESVKENPDYISMTTIVVISHFLKLFGHKHKFTLVIRGIINEKPLIHCPSLKWIFYLIENQVHHLNLLECCDVAKYIQVCIKSHTEKGYFKSGQLIVMLKTLQRIAEKTLDEGDFESIEIFGRMEWFIHLFTHKNFIVRSLTFQLISLIAFSELGADSLTRRLSDVVSIWEICLSALMNEKEALIVRDGSLKTLTNLLYTGHNMYYGPTIKENVSGVLIHGESALTSFLQRANFEEFVVGLLKSFGAIHRIKCEEVEDSCGVSRSNRLENHSFDLDMTPLFMGGLNLFLLSISLNDGNLLKTLDTFTAIDLSDRALESITSNFPLMDYVYYLDSLICIYIKHPVQTLSVEYLFIANSHLASTLFIRRKVAGEEVDHLTRNCFNWYLTILRNTKDTESVHKLANIFKKYEEGLLEANATNACS